MGKKWRFYLGCVLKPIPDENKNNKKTQNSEGKQNNEDFNLSKDVDITMVNPTMPSPKAEVVFIGTNTVGTTSRSSVIAAENEDARNAHSASNNAEADQASNRDSVVEPQNVDAKDAHFTTKDAEDDHTTDGHFVTKVENEDANNANLDVKDADDQGINGYSLIEVDNVDAKNSHSSVKDVNDQVINGYSVIETEHKDAMNPHSAVTKVDVGLETRGYSLIEVENENVSNPHSASKDEECNQTTNKYSVYDAKNKESTNGHYIMKDANDQGLTEVENEDERSSHPTMRDAKEDDPSDIYFVAQAQNGDEKNVYSVGKDVENDMETDEYVVIQTTNKYSRNAHFSPKDVEDDHATNKYFVIEAKNENARNSHFHAKDKDEQAIDGYPVTEEENEDSNSSYRDVEHVEDDDSVVKVDNVDARKTHSTAKIVDDDQGKHAHSTTLTSTASAEVVTIHSDVGVEVTSKEEVATRKIQSAFRGYRARQSFQDVKGIKGLMRLQTVVQAQLAKRQATTTLRCMQTMARVQHQVYATRIRMYKENQELQRQLRQKYDLDKSKSSMRENWIDSAQSMEQIEANRQREQQAVIRRERELAYAYAQQLTWKNSPKQATQAFMEPNNPKWDWNWTEKRMGERPWDNRTIKEELNVEPPSAKSVTTLAHKVRRDLNLDWVKSSPTTKKETLTIDQSLGASSRTTPKSTPASKEKISNSSKRRVHSVNDDSSVSRHTHSVGLERRKRISKTGSLTRDDDKQMNRRFMSPTSSAKAKVRPRMEKSISPLESVNSAKTTLLVLQSTSEHSEPTNNEEAH